MFLFFNYYFALLIDWWFRVGCLVSVLRLVDVGCLPISVSFGFAIVFGYWTNLCLLDGMCVAVMLFDLICWGQLLD